jgi:hypothetical protein
MSQKRDPFGKLRAGYGAPGFVEGGGMRSFASANDAHLRRDKVAPKMGHPVCGVSWELAAHPAAVYG